MTGTAPSIAILYISTGRYTVFWDSFYQSAEKFLLPDCQKHYFIFTDSSDTLVGEGKNVSKIYQKKLGWPYDTLMRFDIFLGIREKLEKYDFIYFFNGNTEFTQTVSQQDILPLETQQNLVFCLQPHMFHLSHNKFSYDRNPESTAYIPLNSGRYYFAGGLNGGKAKPYLDMCNILNDRIRQDLKQNIIALWHDESQLNKYALNRTDIKILPPYFSRSEAEYWKKNAKVMFSDKSHYRFGGHAYLRGESEQKVSEIEWKKANGKKRKRYSFRAKQFIKSFFIRN